MKILLIQARNADDPMLAHEAECFAKRCELPLHHFECVNVVVQSLDRAMLDRADVVMVGGSGDYSLVGPVDDWRADLLQLMRDVVQRRQPMFGSCFGFQALVKAFGGELVHEPSWAEVGTFDITLTEEGVADPLFAGATPTFAAQLGHNDSATAPLPEPLIALARSERAPVQAVRVRDAPIVATQFHPELTIDDNILRYLRYLQRYDPSLTTEQAEQVARQIHRPTPFANTLLRRFLNLVK